MKLFALLFAAAICRAQNAPGLLAALNDGSHSLQLAVPTPNFYLDANESLHPQLGPAVEAEFTGNLTIVQAGEYRFDAGEATLEIDGRVGAQFELTAGDHPIRLHFLRRPGIAALQLRWMSSKFGWEPVPGSAFSHRAIDTPAETGRTLVESAGCANCHAAPSLARAASPLKTRTVPIPDRHVPAILLNEGTAETQGCVACHATRGLTNRLNARPLHEVYTAACKGARYEFSIVERDAIKAFLKTYRGHPDRSSAPVYAIRRLLAEERCAACHRQTPIPPAREPHYPADARAWFAKANGAAPR